MNKYIISFTVCICASVFPILAQNLHVVFIGNSITQGVQLKDAKHEAPPAQAALFLQEHIKGTVEFRNCGRSGRTTLNFLPVTNTEFPKVLAAATSSTSEKNECCITFPIERTTATTAAALNNGMKRAVNVMRYAMTTGTSTSASTRASKSSPKCTSC